MAKVAKALTFSMTMTYKRRMQLLLFLTVVNLYFRFNDLSVSCIALQTAVVIVSEFCNCAVDK